jgi:hypothetical protein
MVVVGCVLLGDGLGWRCTHVHLKAYTLYTQCELSPNTHVRRVLLPARLACVCGLAPHCRHVSLSLLHTRAGLAQEQRDCVTRCRLSVGEGMSAVTGSELVL